MVVRVSTFDTTPWDDRSLNEQEQAVGRFKYSGASLDLDDDPRRLNDDPAF
jgi:Dyp-type peroxidase family